MKKANRILAAGIAAAIASAVPALAEQMLSGDVVHKLLAGQNFEFNCADGTRGEASYARSGVATASYRLPTFGGDAVQQKDHGRVRANGEALCIRWNNLNGGEEACFRTSERSPGRYRISDGPARWCDLTVRGIGDRASRN